MNDIDELFGDVNVVATKEIATTFGLSETDARTWADELGVTKVGASFAWTREDAEALADQLTVADEEDEEDEE